MAKEVSAENRPRLLLIVRSRRVTGGPEALAIRRKPAVWGLLLRRVRGQGGAAFRGFVCDEPPGRDGRLFPPPARASAVRVRVLGPTAGDEHAGHNPSVSLDGRETVPRRLQRTMRPAHAEGQHRWAARRGQLRRDRYAREGCSERSGAYGAARTRVDDRAAAAPREQVRNVTDRRRDQEHDRPTAGGARASNRGQTLRRAR
jgi:hypothetical protein